MPLKASDNWKCPKSPLAPTDFGIDIATHLLPSSGLFSLSNRPKSIVDQNYAVLNVLDKVCMPSTYRAVLLLLCLPANLGFPVAQAIQNCPSVPDFQDLEHLSGLESPAYRVLLHARRRLESLGHPTIINHQRLQYDTIRDAILTCARTPT